MQKTLINKTSKTSISLFPKQTFASEILLTDSNIRSFEVITENSTYCFLKVGQTTEDFPLWYVISGQKDLLGCKVGVLVLNEKGLSPKAINRGDRLAICLNEVIADAPVKVWYTTKILNFSILDYQDNNLSNLKKAC
ncbi:MAG: hypothetical protein IPK14_17220 [Blastocatellia bacterium]|nr:hypothetical protein [Blastocatellia bacterium]